MPARPLITLLTDFGTADTYAGQMKGVIAGICPDATVIDLTHAVLPQQVAQGAFLLETALDAFPTGTIHVAVVDPGVGTDRAGLLIRTADRVFIGPDNGLLSCALPEEARPDALRRIPLPRGVDATVLPPELGRPVSSTFHGRDIFAVAAARLAAGDEAITHGTAAGGMLAVPPFRATVRGRREMLDGHIVHIDRFGNLVTTVHASQLRRAAVTGERPVIHVGSERIEGFVRTYGQGAGLVALIGSSGYLEVAEVNGSAAVRLGARIGQDVRVELVR
jgi:S-adenosyl-L-methionine hydrolase (adenosine-forming)